MLHTGEQSGKLTCVPRDGRSCLARLRALAPTGKCASELERKHNRVSPPRGLGCTHPEVALAVFSWGTPNSNRWMLAIGMVQVSLLPLPHRLLGCTPLGHSRESDRSPGDNFYDRRRGTLENSRARCGSSPVSLQGHGSRCWAIIVLSASDSCKYKALSRKLSLTLCTQKHYIPRTWMSRQQRADH